MDSSSYAFLKIIYDNKKHQMYMWDKKSPFFNGFSGNDTRDILCFLRDNGYLKQKDGLWVTTMAGNEYIESRNRKDNTYKLSVAAIIISVLALLKPPSFDLIALFISLARSLQ